MINLPLPLGKQPLSCLLMEIDVAIGGRLPLFVVLKPSGRLKDLSGLPTRALLESAHRSGSFHFLEFARSGFAPKVVLSVVKDLLLRIDPSVSSV